MLFEKSVVFDRSFLDDGHATASPIHNRRQLNRTECEATNNNHNKMPIYFNFSAFGLYDPAKIFNRNEEQTEPSQIHEQSVSIQSAEDLLLYVQCMRECIYSSTTHNHHHRKRRKMNQRLQSLTVAKDVCSKLYQFHLSPVPVTTNSAIFARYFNKIRSLSLSLSLPLISFSHLYPHRFSIWFSFTVFRSKV